MTIFKMTKEECIAEASMATESSDRTRQICAHFYKLTGELLSSYC